MYKFFCNNQCYINLCFGFRGPILSHLYILNMFHEFLISLNVTYKNIKAFFIVLL